MQKHFDTLKQSRKLILTIVENLSIEQLNKIPQNFKNNIVWNIAHLVVTQQLLCYKLSGLNCLISDTLIAGFQKGTAPTYTVEKDEFEIIKQLFLELPEKLEQDYNNAVFKNYNEYTTSVNVTLQNIDDAIIFNTYHEGIHLGVILQLLKFI
ncbi:DinB family protein [Lutibacter sp. B1]|uniref:DinB family protein n=1 Tax=Lutibacter sp. B1 TaxID=2725996 RepID=UPI0014565957|nr:DinB family protein [Lutibacter sp. B1]NLP57638.1 DinB family protein [Lutibacter sp. B1]